MNVWLVFAAVLLLGAIPAGIAALRGNAVERFTGLQAAQSTFVLVMVLIAQGLGRSIHFDLAVAMAILTLVSGLVFARFLERWL